MMQIIKRQACRALLITPDGQILLTKIEEPSTGWSAWITPGGGISEAESAHDGLLRELREELDLIGATIGPEVWRRFHAFTWEDRNIEQHESYYLVKTAHLIRVVAMLWNQSKKEPLNNSNGGPWRKFIGQERCLYPER